jgi:UDP-glucose 4-epimerase
VTGNIDTDSESMTEELTDATVLVTGGAGFIGSRLVEALVEDNNVRVLDDLSTGRREFVHTDAELIVGDVCDEGVVRKAMAGVDVVFHQAAVVSVDRSVEAPTETHAVNIDGTLAVLEAARAEKVRVVVASSAAIYGDPVSVPIDESHPTEPLSPYGLEKLAVDQYARLYHDLYGLETVALRYFNAYGPRQTGGDYAGVISVFREQARNGGPLTVHGDGTQTRDFVHVSDIVRASQLAATTEVTGEAFNIGTGHSHSVLELAEIVRDLVDGAIPVEHVKAREGDIQQSRADISKARETLDYQPRWNLREGLEELLR